MQMVPYHYKKNQSTNIKKEEHHTKVSTICIANLYYLASPG